MSILKNPASIWKDRKAVFEGIVSFEEWTAFRESVIAAYNADRYLPKAEAISKGIKCNVSLISNKVGVRGELSLTDYANLHDVLDRAQGSKDLISVAGKLGVELSDLDPATATIEDAQRLGAIQAPNQVRI